MKADEARALVVEYEREQIESLNYENLYKQIKSTARNGGNTIHEYMKHITMADNIAIPYFARQDIKKHLEKLGYSIHDTIDQYDTEYMQW